jgi:hypothetical protein
MTIQGTHRAARSEKGAGRAASTGRIDVWTALPAWRSRSSNRRDQYDEWSQFGGYTLQRAEHFRDGADGAARRPSAPPVRAAPHRQLIGLPPDSKGEKNGAANNRAAVLQCPQSRPCSHVPEFTSLQSRPGISAVQFPPPPTGFPSGTLALAAVSVFATGGVTAGGPSGAPRGFLTSAVALAPAGALTPLIA